VKAAGRAFLPAVGLFLFYAGVSLYDPWPNVPPLVHGVLFAVLVGVVVGRAVFALRVLRTGETVPPVRWGRYGLLLPFLAIGLYLAAGDLERRMVVGFMPSILFPPPHMDIDARIEPPDYTREPGVRLAISPAGETVRVPEGARIIVRARSTRWPPVLGWDGADEPLRERADGLFEIAGEIRANSNLVLAFGDHVLARWQIEVVPDEPPQVALTAPVEVTPRLSVKLPLEARDDYGVSYLALRLRPADDAEATPMLVDLSAYGTRHLDEVQYLDLTAHPLAGTEVVGELVAVDAKGQDSVSPAFPVSLPKRRFTNVTALAIQSARQALMRPDPEVDMASRRLAALTESDTFPADTTVHLGLRLAFLRLRNDPDPATVEEMTSLLWDLALRAEDGTLSLSEIALHDALGATMALIKAGAQPPEVEAALRNLAFAFEEFGRARSSRLYVNPAVRIAADEELRESLDWAALRRFFGRLTLLAQEGAMGAVLGELADLQEGLETRPDLVLSATAYRRYLVASYARRMLDELTREQRILMSRALVPAIRPEGQAADKGPRASRLAGNQRALRDALVTVIEHLDRAGLPHLEAFYRARQAMDDAVRSLEQGDGEGNAASAQVQVLTALDMASKVLDSVPSPLMVDEQGRVKDPLGRPLPPVNDRSGLPLPDSVFGPLP